MKTTTGRTALFLHNEDYTGDITIVSRRMKPLIDPSGFPCYGITVPFSDVLSLVQDFLIREMELKFEQLKKEVHERI